MDVCTPNGYVQRSTISKANLIHIPSLYTALRKTTWGGLYPVLTSDEGSRNALARTAKGTRLRSEADDVSVHPANYVTSSLDPTYREDSGKSAQRGGGGGVAGVGLKARAGKTGGSPQQQQGGGGSRKDRNASPSRTVDRFDEDDDGSPRRGGERSSRSSGGGGGGKVRMEEITASAGSAQYRKIQMAQAFGKEAAQKGKSFGGANNNNISGGGGSAGGAPAAPKTGLAGQLERMKRRREEKAREQQQQKKKDSEAV